MEIVKNLGKYKIQLSVFLMLIIIWAIFLIGSPTAFLSFPIYGSFMSTIPMTAIMSLALTYVIICGEIDLSFASIMAVSGWVFVNVFERIGNIYLGLILCLIIGTVAGILNGLIIIKFKIPSIVATIGTMFFWRGLNNILSSGLGVSIVDARETFLYKIVVGRIGGLVPAQIIWTIIIAIILSIFLNYHRIGRHIYFIGDNMKSAKMMGVNVNLVKIFTFSLLGFFAAVAAIVAILEITYYYPSLGSGYLLQTIAPVFLGGTSPFGGTGTLFGTFIGTIIVGCIEAGIVAMGVSGFWTQLIYGLIIIISVAAIIRIKKNK